MASTATAIMTMIRIATRAQTQPGVAATVVVATVVVAVVAVVTVLAEVTVVAVVTVLTELVVTVTAGTTASVAEYVVGTVTLSV